MASGNEGNKSPTLATDELKFFETSASDKPANESNEDELKFFGKPKQSPVVSQLANSATKSGSTADLLVDFDGAKSNAKAAAPPAAAGDADQKQVNLLDDTPLDS